MRLSEVMPQVTMVESKDYGSAGVTSDAVNSGLFAGLVQILISLGALTGNSTLKVYASAGRDLTTTEIAWKYRVTGAAYKAANADQYGDATAVAIGGLSLVAGTFAHKQLSIELDTDSLPDGSPWVTFVLDNVATVLNVAAFAQGPARFKGHVIPTVL